MNVSAVKEKCTGCSLCSILCPKHCITMQQNEEGFAYPLVNDEQCVQCGICVSKCPIESSVEYNHCIKCYAAKSKDKHVYMRSASGGVATELAKTIICAGGIVYGCELTEDFKTRHCRIDDVDKLYRIQSSKYTQSNITDVLADMKNECVTEKNIAFFGTPCQIAAAKQYCGNADNILYVDLICHGVTNDLIFHSYLKYVERRSKTRVISFNYRDKEASSDSRCESLMVQRKDKIVKVVHKLIDSPYYYGYLDNDISRQSCYDCAFRGMNRVGDITLGDFWGVDRIVDGIDNDFGYSRVLLNTSKGLHFYEKLDGLQNAEVVYNEEAITKHDIPLKREKFFSSRNSNLDYDWSILRPKHYIFRKLYSSIPFSLRKKIYRMVRK